MFEYAIGINVDNINPVIKKAYPNTVTIRHQSVYVVMR